jgi:hypothetical protein
MNTNELLVGMFLGSVGTIAALAALYVLGNLLPEPKDWRPVRSEGETDAEYARRYDLAWEGVRTRLNHSRTGFDPPMPDGYLDRLVKRKGVPKAPPPPPPARRRSEVRVYHHTESP